MSKTSLPAATLKPGEERRMLRGHLWAYRNEFGELPALADGDLFDVFSASRRFVCRAFYQAEGGIAGRALAAHQVDIDADFLRKRLGDAMRFRARLYPGSAVYRWVYGESDGLPGLVIDRYGPVASVQTSCAFYRQRRDALSELLLQREGVATVVFLGEGGHEVRGSALDPLELDLDGVRAGIAIDRSQKTGLFLDQRENWPQVRRFAKGASVLDGFCYHGLWGIHAALGGAAGVLGVDNSESAVIQARANAALNGVEDRCVFEKARVEEVLERGVTFDLIVIDPPAFAKTRGQAKKAMTRYEEINRKALNALSPGGILFTCSCSHFMPTVDFLEAVKRAARSLSRSIRVLGVRGAAPDHPVLPVMAETEYLKCVILHAP